MKKLNNKQISVYVILTLIVIVGLIFRLKGISQNNSFWSDEALTASLARDIVKGTRSIPNALSLLDYQPLHVLTTAVSFTVLGISEFTARLPEVIWGTIGIIAVFLFSAALSNPYGGLLAAFVYSFAQINLANSTQVKPYAVIQTLFLLVLYLITLLDSAKFACTSKRSSMIHGLIILFATAATLYHYIGVLIWIPYIIFLLTDYRKTMVKTFRKPKLLFILVVLITGLFFLISGPRILTSFTQHSKNLLYVSNNFTYVRELFWRNYAFITLPALMGLLTVFFIKRNYTLGLAVMLLFYLYLWTFKSYTHNIRYLVPLFGILFAFFGIFWGRVGEKLLPNKAALVCALVAIVVMGGGYKMTRKPAAYYTPNADFFADVQIADYKTFYSEFQKRFPDVKDTAVFNDWYDTQYYYMPQKDVDVYFIKGRFAQHPEPINFDHHMIYGDLKQFLAEKAKYKKGFLVVEDWQSLLPDDIKNYAKKNLKREFRVEGLPQAQGDNWPLELYSWGR